MAIATLAEFVAGAEGRVMNEPIFPRLALIGIGLIGSSIAHAAARAGAGRAHRRAIAGPRTTLRSVPRSSTSATATTPTRRMRRATPMPVILCIPVGASGEAAKAIAPALKPGAIVSDVGSVKASVVAQVSPHLPKEVHFVPAHPVAGTEYSGPDAGFAELFDNRWTILTPPPGTDPAAVERMHDFWKRLGANVEVMTPEHHDLVLAITSHVPHLIAYNIVGTAAASRERDAARR